MVRAGITPDDVKDIDDKPRDPDSMVESGRRSAPAKVITIYPIYLIYLSYLSHSIFGLISHSAYITITITIPTITYIFSPTAMVE